MSLPTTIQTAALLIARDNGMINLGCSEEQFLAQTEEYLSGHVFPSTLEAVEDELNVLTASELDDICCGEDGGVGISDKAKKVLDLILERDQEYTEGDIEEVVPRPGK